MAGQVEVVNGTEPIDRDTAADGDSDVEIMTLKQALKEKMRNENVIATINGNAESASNTNGINNGTFENGHDDEKQMTDSEHGSEISPMRRTPKKTSKAKQSKAKRDKKATSSKSKRQTPVKKCESPGDEDTTRSEQSWNGMEVSNKDAEDDNSTIDVIGDNDDAMVVEENEFSIDDDDVKTEISNDEKSEVKEESTMFSRIRNSMRFSITPRKETNSSSSGIPPLGNEFNSYTLRSIGGRRALHQSLPTCSSYDTQPDNVPNLKRKAESLDDSTPPKRYLISSLTESSPGWKFFSSPFSRFWTPKKSSDLSVSSSTPVRELHEEVEDSMTVNVDDSISLSLHEEDCIDVDKDIEKDFGVIQKDFGGEPSGVSKNVPVEQTNWRCSIM